MAYNVKEEEVEMREMDAEDWRWDEQIMKEVKGGKARKTII